MPNPVIIGNATLYLGDCLEILPTLPKVDAVITDPPYGIGYVQRSGKGVAGKSAFCGVSIIGDDKDFDPSPFLSFPIAILFGANYYANKLPIGRWFVWDKRCGVTPQRDQADCEMAWTNNGKACRMFRHVWDGMIKDSEMGVSRDHPTQKPIELMKWCIEQVGNPEAILDPFMGSGTTGVACMNLGRKFIGIEIEPKYFDIACRRIDDAQRQVRMFP
jgi:site-specific DNA-methyltransferase (adenine-specific)/modification methylase